MKKQSIIAILIVILTIVIVVIYMQNDLKHNSSSDYSAYSNGRVIAGDTLLIEKIAYRFYLDNPNFDNNEVTRKQALADFKEMIIPVLLSNRHLLDSIPVRFIDIVEKKGKYTAHFRSYGFPNGFRSPYFSDILFDIVTNVSTEDVAILKEREFYYIYPKFIGDLNISSFPYMLGKKTQIATDDWGIDKDRYNGSLRLSLGCMLADCDSIVKYKP